MTAANPEKPPQANPSETTSLVRGPGDTQPNTHSPPGEGRQGSFLAKSPALNSGYKLPPPMSTEFSVGERLLRS
ncbi:hypothetical protein AAFF_G00207380 [Aldrovandia affinis]|uniref:Uncharacterized protein n=1 Tax=Aldrovandia affinis TaxID=143900 RepID=A0AAD7RI10_9TELE|nr:hypothetical protein AAFF_G00207380 [Aldrovandia affinis]